MLIKITPFSNAIFPAYRQAGTTGFHTPIILQPCRTIYLT